MILSSQLTTQIILGTEKLYMLMGIGSHSMLAIFWQKILLLVLVEIRKQIAIPLSYSFLVNRGHPEHESVLKKAASLVDECLEQGFPKLPVVADSWFVPSNSWATSCHTGMTYITEVKSRKVARDGTGQWVRYKKITETFNSPRGKRYSGRGGASKSSSEI